MHLLEVHHFLLNRFYGVLRAQQKAEYVSALLEFVSSFFFSIYLYLHPLLVEKFHLIFSIFFYLYLLFILGRFFHPSYRPSFLSFHPSFISVPLSIRLSIFLFDSSFLSFGLTFHRLFLLLYFFHFFSYFSLIMYQSFLKILNGMSRKII